MLPYRLRPPIYGGKLKQQKKQQQGAATTAGAATAGESSRRQHPSAHNKSDNHPSNYAGGGPVQQAIKLDLLLWRPVFCEELLKQRQPETRHNDDKKRRRHDPPGRVFGIFQQKVFARAKMALLHTRTIPPRCHDNAYSQLLYAACLSLLRDAFVGVDDASKDSFHFEHAAYAIFCLYALVETSPSCCNDETTTTTAVDTSSPASLLPLGLATSRENPKLLHRRTVFKNPQRQRVVRIDSSHYVLLQQVRDECLAQQADCQAKCMRQRLLNRIEQNQVGTDDDEAWCCTCGVATDVVQVLDRLMLPGVLDLVEYTGPCGLEGYVGHEDYYYQQQPPPSSPATKDPILKNRELDAVGRTATQHNQSLLPALMEKYQTSLNRLLPAAAPEENSQRHPKRRNRLIHPVAASRSRSNAAALSRDILLRQSSSNVRTWQEMAQELRTSCTNGFQYLSTRGTSTTPHGRERSMMVGNVEEETSNTSTPWHPEDGVSDATAVPIVQNGRMDDDESSIAAAQEKTMESKRSLYRLTTPSDLPTSLQDGIRKALGVLLEREGDEILRQNVVTAHPMEISAVPASWSRNDGGAYDDDWSSVGGASSIMQYSTASAAGGQGQAALSALLARAGAATAQATPDKGKTSGLPGTAGIAMPARANTRLPTSLQLTTKSVPKQNAREQFLTLMESSDMSQEKESDEFSSGQVSDLSSGDEDDDEVSIATSAVGQTALRTLLAAVNGNNNTATLDVAVAPAAASQKKRTNSTKRKISSSPQQTKRTRRRVPQDESAASGQIVAPPHSSPMSDDDTSLLSNSTRGAGKAALDALLAQVVAVPNKNPHR